MPIIQVPLLFRGAHDAERPERWRRVIATLVICSLSITMIACEKFVPSTYECSMLLFAMVLIHRLSSSLRSQLPTFNTDVAKSDVNNCHQSHGCRTGLEP